MKKWLILIILLMPLANAYELNNDNYKMDVGIVIGNNISNENYMLDVVIYPIQYNLSNINYKLNFGYLTNWIVSIVPPIVVIPGVGGGSGAVFEYTTEGIIAITPYYDIIIDNIKPTYDSEEIIYPIITIINKGDVPDRDANLTYYLLSPANKRIGESREVFEEVPPTCPNATYDRYEDICRYEDKTTFEPLKTILEREIALPLNTTYGQWKFYVEYETEVQPPIQVFKTFRVGIGQLYFIPLAIILLLLYLLNLNKSKNKSESEISR